MTKTRTYNLTEAAAYIGVSYQAAQQRFGSVYNKAETPFDKPRHEVPQSALEVWRKERIANAKAKLSAVSGGGTK